MTAASSGVPQAELGVQPPATIRNCLAALAGRAPWLHRTLFSTAPSAVAPRGPHSFGNLFLTALTAINRQPRIGESPPAAGLLARGRGQVVQPTTARMCGSGRNSRTADRPLEGEFVRFGQATSRSCGWLHPERPPALPGRLKPSPR